MEMGFKFFAYGILAVAAFLFLLYFLGQTEQYKIENGEPFLYLGGFIVIAFIIYMFAKLAKR
jgi:hypothetical protein